MPTDNRTGIYSIDLIFPNCWTPCVLYGDLSASKNPRVLPAKELMCPLLKMSHMHPLSDTPLNCNDDIG